MEEEGGRKLRPDPFAGDCEDGGGLGSRIPTYIDDIPTKTTDPGVGPRCNHGLLPMTRIAFEGDSTGRRFLGSPFEVRLCVNLVHSCGLYMSVCDFFCRKMTLVMSIGLIQNGRHIWRLLRVSSGRDMMPFVSSLELM